MLTNLRCLLLTRPRPFRRAVRWAQGLEGVRSLAVAPVRGLPRGRVTVRGGFGGGTLGPMRIDPTYSVAVNSVDVFIGEPAECESVQAWIDEARAARCVALYGRVLPFQGTQV